MHHLQRTRRQRQGRFLEVIGVTITMFAVFVAFAGLSAEFVASLRFAVPLLVIGIGSFVMGYRRRLIAHDGE